MKLLIIYLISIIILYLSTRYQTKHKIGIYVDNESSFKGFLILLFCPIINTAVCIASLVALCIELKIKRINYYKFFFIKKEK